MQFNASRVDIKFEKLQLQMIIICQFSNRMSSSQFKCRQDVIIINEEEAAAATTTQRRQQMRLCDRVPITEASRTASVRWIRTWIRCSASKRSVP